MLPSAPWRTLPALHMIGLVLGTRDTRIVGGAVRDTLAGQFVSDIDLATQLLPTEVMARLDAAKIKCIPTGIAHGTVTAVTGSIRLEITTLRRDVSTDGRRATVAFTSDWREDAARRDFTVNALYADIETGEVFDYFGGVADLSAGIVRFIGAPLQRIAEDHLRILRFFRFSARYSRGDLDHGSLAACAARANDLMALSRERIADELFKLLALPSPHAVMSAMLANGIWKPVLPEIMSAQPLLLLTDTDPTRRLAGLLPPAPEIVAALAKRLKLSKAITKRLVAAAGRNSNDIAAPRATAYRHGAETARDRLILQGRSDLLPLVENWVIPTLPIGGGTLVKLGLPEGPVVAVTLKQIEEQWIAEGFPGGERVMEIAANIIC